MIKFTLKAFNIFFGRFRISTYCFGICKIKKPEQVLF